MSSKSIRRKSILQRAVVETLDKRVLLSGTPHDYVWKEAENYDATEDATDGHYWASYSQGGFSGSGVQAKESDKVKYEFGDAANSARLDYTANFAQAGKYYVWVRGIGFDGNSDSVHIGINGQPALSAGNIAVRREGVLWSTFSTENGAAGYVIIPSAGQHTINLYMREAGTSVDQILLTTDKAFRPANAPAVPVVTLASTSASSGTTKEGNPDGMTYTFTRSSGAGENTLRIAIQPTGGTANPNDYLVMGSGVTLNGDGTYSVLFGLDDVQKQITVRAYADSDVEGEESVALAVVEPGGSSPAYHVGGSTTTTTTFADLPVVWLESPRDGFEQGKVPYGFTIRRSGPTDESLTIDLRNILTGRHPSFTWPILGDFGDISGERVIPAGQDSLIVNGFVADDRLVEPDDFVDAWIMGTDRYALGSPSELQLTIHDNDVSGTVPPPDLPIPPLPPIWPDPPAGTTPPVGDWIDLQLGSWWDDEMGNPWTDEDASEATDPTPDFGSTEGGDGLSEGHFIRLNSDFDELTDSPSPGEQPTRDLETEGVLPGDGEVVPLTFGFGSIQTLENAAWTLEWNSDKIKIWTPTFDDDGEFVEYIEQASGWSATLEDYQYSWYWTQYGVGAWVEGVQESSALNDVAITATLIPQGRDAVADVVKATVVDVDLDVDSDNTSLTAVPELSTYEDYVEDTRGSKLMIVNRDDDDEDGYADYAGINPAASGSSSQLVDDDLVQLSISFSGVLASSSFKISFTYNAYADESVLTETLEVPAYDGETYEKYRHSLGEGLFRLWLVQPTSERRLIASEELVDLGDLQASGGEASKLYLEALNGANTSQSIHISVWKDEEILIAADAIKAIPIDPGLGLAAEIEIEGYNIVRGSGAISGTSGNDLILGSMYNDQIDAGMGDDVVVPFAGDDLIDLGSGSDLVFGFFGNKQFNSDTSDVVSYIEGGYVQDPEPESLQAFATGETDAQSVLVSSVNTATNGAQHPCVRSMNGRDVIAAYKWMFGDDLWLKLFNSQHINGRVIAVSDRRDGPPEYDIDYETAGNWPYTQLKKVTVKITYGQIDQIEAANQLRSAILNELIDDYYDKVKDFLTDIFASAKTDKVVFSEALEAWADLRQRNITYVAEIATLAAKLNPFFFPGGIGASAAQAFFELPDLAEAGVDALKSLFNLIPIIPGDTSDWENDDGEMPTAAALVNGQGQLFPDFAALSIGAALRLRIAAATGMKLFDVAKDVIKPAGNTLGFVWRRDFINGRAIPMALEVVPLASGKTTLVIGTAQVVPGTTHAATALAKAQQLAQTGLYSHITLARNWRTATGRIGNWKDPAVKALQNKIPDLIAVRWDGKVVPFEVQSSGDTVAVLRTRLENSMATLPTANQTEIGTSNIIPLSPG